MSTKIYEAWRIPIERLNDFIDHVRPLVLEATAKEIREAAKHFKDEALGAPPDYASGPDAKPGAYERWRHGAALDMIIKESKANNNYWDHIDAWLNIWLFKGKAYVHGRNVAKHAPVWAQDYSYWNNSDRPDGVTQRAWDARGKRWDEICCGSGFMATNEHNARRLSHGIVDVAQLGFCFELRALVMGREWRKAMGVK